MTKAAATRHHILQKAFELIYTKGYNATSIDDILATTEVTKGAFYYHFRNKDEMGLAIINEVLKPALSDSFLQPLQKSEDPLEVMYDMMYHLLMKNRFMKVAYGCPASNLTQEMAPWNRQFSKALDGITHQWEGIMTDLIEKGKRDGFVRAGVNAKEVVLFVMSGYWGIRNFGKLSGTREVYKPYLSALKNYLHSLR
ncbi:MAG TPA: TetR/AcrR family transcriptional regulator [Chitinophagaceae bacterium]|jgi:AcrR family transcriptional regulator|nr:TetR/AcrR family transcriptional regulator [Chitinophagaceae bacterium]